MRKVLVTGGAGFIGSNIVDALVRRGDQVRVLDNLCTGKLSNLADVKNRIEFIEADLTDAAAVARAVEGVDCVFHEAALASVPRSVEHPLDTNAACVTGTLVLLDCARKAGVRRVVYAASSSAYGNQPAASKRESDLPMPISPYGAAKVAAEYYCQAFAAMGEVETVSLRYFNVFGPRQDPNSEYSAVIPKFITLLLRGQRPTIFGDGYQSRDFTFVGDVVAGNLLAADAPHASGRVFNVATGRQINLLDMLGLLNRLLKTKIEPIFAPPRAGDVRESLADITLARQNLQYEPQVQFEEGLRRSIDYYLKIVGK
jgi:UDP-glucose 4-epimerase